jgi:hypothetical protein
MGFLASVDDVLRRVPEAAWLEHVIGLARMGGLPWFHDWATNAPRRCPRCKFPINLPRNPPGFPDLVILRGDTAIVAELKSARGRMTDDQRAWLAAWRKVRRVVVVVWRPTDRDAAERMLRGEV